MSHRVNVEEVWKNNKGEFNGMSSGRPYEKSEVEQIGNFWWTKATPPPGNVVLETEDCKD